VRMTGCTKIFVQPVVVTGKNCSENTMKKTPKMLKGCSKKTSGHESIKPYRTYLYRNKVLVITKVTTQDTPKPVFKELCHRLYRNLKLPTNTVRQSTATSQFNRSPQVAPNTFKQLVIVQKHTLTPTRIIKPPTLSVREVPPRQLP
jgi:hypothetical protein